MSKLKIERVWTTQELEDWLTAEREYLARNSHGLAEYLAKCTRLMAAWDALEWGKHGASLHLQQLRAAIEAKDET